MKFPKRKKSTPNARPNWVRGPYNLLDRLESKASKPIIQTNYLPVREQLKKLFEKEPNNNFYETIIKYNIINPLTPKQISVIINHYKKKISPNGY